MNGCTGRAQASAKQSSVFEMVRFLVVRENLPIVASFASEVLHFAQLESSPASSNHHIASTADLPGDCGPVYTL